MSRIDQIKNWVLEGKNKKNCTHVMIVCDIFDHTDYPVYITNKDDIQDKIIELSNKQNMSKIMEIYKMNIDIEKQLNEIRTYHI